MTVTINKTDGTVLTTIADGSANTDATNIALIGRLYKNYGELINENFVKLLENFANTTSPSTPIVGQIWYDKSTNNLKVYRSTGFISMARMTSSAAQPSNAVIADFWWDTADAQLKLYNGASWTVIAPPYTSAMSKTGAFAENIADVTTANHIAVVIYQQNQAIAIFSKDTAYVPQVAITGFSTIGKGLTLSNIADFKMHGTATNADAVDNISSEQFLRSDENDTTSGTLSVLNDSGFIVGVDSDVKISVDSTTGKITKLTAGNLQFIMGTDLAMVITDSERVQFQSGTAALPAITFIGDDDTGIYRIGDNQIGLATNGNLSISVGTAATSVTGNLNVSGDVDVSGELIVDLDATITGALDVSGNVDLGNAAGDQITIRAGTMSIPNDLSITGGDVGITGALVVGGAVNIIDNVSVTGNTTMTGTFSVTGSAAITGGLVVAPTDSNDFVVTSNGRIRVNASSVATGYDNEGDMTFAATNGIFARNVPKYVCTFNGNLAGLAILRSHHVATVTRTATGTYTLTLANDNAVQVPLISAYPTFVGSVSGDGSFNLNSAGSPSAGDTSISVKTVNMAGTATDYARAMFAIWDGDN